MNNKTIACLVTSSPRDRDSAQQALAAVQSMLADKITIDHIFFYGDGVETANTKLSTNSNEQSPTHAWQTIAADNDIPLIVCVTAAEKRNIFADDNLALAFEAHGMGEFFSRLHDVEQLVQV